MKTDKEASEEFAYSLVPNPSQYETRTTSSDKWEDARDSFLAGCKHKEESRWIPVDPDNLPEIEVIGIGYQRNILVGYLGVDESGIFCENDFELLEDVTHYQLKPQPPKTK